MKAGHPYYPPGIEIPNYIKNELAFTTCLAILGSALASILFVIWRVTKYLRPDLPRFEVLTVLWFTLCASLHLGFESYFVRHWNNLAAQQGLLGQLWKEYSYSDSRYLTQDPEVLCLEVITVILWGPLSVTTALMILRSHPLRHGFQIIISMAHLYGDVLYYATSLFGLWFTGQSHSRPEPLYFWVYFIGFNAPWVVVPVLLIWSSLNEISNVTKLAAANLKKKSS